MNIRRALSLYSKCPRKLIRALGVRNFFNWLPDRFYLKLVYYGETGRKLDLRNPDTFNEKMQWLKLYDKNPLYETMVDKYQVRKYISEKIGEEYLIPLLGVWDNAADIDFTALPDSFVLKCTHGSNNNIICKTKNELDFNKTTKMLHRWMKRNLYWFGREWPYKNVMPRIIAEKYMVDESGYELKDYKVFCFNGCPKIIQVHFNRKINSRIMFYDTDWKYIPISTRYQTDPEAVIKKPERLTEMLEMACVLSDGLPYLRVDFYSIGDRFFFGELTLYPASGFGKFSPDEWNYILGNWIDLKLAYTFKQPHGKDRI